MLKIVVFVDSEGRVMIEGPLKNKLLCYGLLEAGKDAVRNHREGAIQEVTGVAAGAVLGQVVKPS